MASTSTKKELILAVAFLTSHIAVFWFWERAVSILMAEDAQGWLSLLAPTPGLILSAALFSLAALFISSSRISYASAATAAVIPFFWVPADLVTGLVLISCLALACFAVWRVKKNKEQTAGFSLTKILQSGIPVYFTVSALTVAMFYRMEINNYEPFQSIMPQTAFTRVMDTVSGAVASAAGFPEIGAETTVDELLRELIRNQIQTEGPEVQLPEREMERLIALQRREMEEQLGVELSGDERVFDVFYNTLAVRIHDISGPYRQYIPVVAVIAFFLAFKTFTWPLYYLTLLTAYVIVWALKRLGILVGQKHSVEIETVAFGP